MSVGKTKISEDRYQNKMQISHIDTANYFNLVAGVPVRISTVSDTHIRVASTGTDAWVRVHSDSYIPAANVGMFLAAGDSYHTTLRAGEYIGSTVILNIVPLGEI